jgi:hypothetical protein
VCREEYGRQRWWTVQHLSPTPSSRLHRRVNKIAVWARRKLKGKHSFACCLSYGGVVHLRNVSRLPTNYTAAHYINNSWHYWTMIVRYCFTLFVWCRVKKKTEMSKLGWLIGLVKHALWADSLHFPVPAVSFSFYNPGLIPVYSMTIIHYYKVKKRYR